MPSKINKTKKSIPILLITVLNNVVLHLSCREITTLSNGSMRRTGSCQDHADIHTHKKYYRYLIRVRMVSSVLSLVPLIWVNALQ